MSIEDKTLGQVIVTVGSWVLLGIIVITLLSGFYIVGAGERAVVLTWGDPSPVAATEGLHYRIPIAQKIVKLDVKTQKYDASASAASKDLQIVSTNIAVNYHLTPESVPTLYKEIGLDYENRIIQPAVQEVVKASTAQFTAEELITKRSSVKDKIDEGLHERLLKRGIVLETTSITNFDFSAEFNRAIEAKVTAEQNALQAANVVKMKEFEAQQAVATAEGQAESTKRVADAQAYAKKVVADADAYGLRVVREELSKDNSLIQYRQIEKWSGTLPQFYMSSDGASTPMIVQLPALSTQ